MTPSGVLLTIIVATSVGLFIGYRTTMFMEAEPLKRENKILKKKLKKLKGKQKALTVH